MDNKDRAETFAEYYEKVQWAGPNEATGSEALPARQPQAVRLAMDTGELTPRELRAVLGFLKKGKACGPDSVPAELWVAMAEDDEALQHLLLVCNTAWQNKQIPDDWSTATVVTIFKSGLTALPKNYRPISLLCVGYKILARLMLNRLRASDVEKK